MSATKTIAVVGATGATAGGLARAIVSDPAGGYACRAITRDPASAAARALSDQGATVVRADLDDYDSLMRAFDGAYGAFCMTNFFVHFSAEQEAQQAAHQARAAAVAKVNHAIWSTAEDTRRWYPLDNDKMPTLHGGYKVPNWDGKGEGDHFFAAAGVPTTYLLTPFHWEAFVFGLGAPATGPRRRAHPGHAAWPGAATRHHRRGHRPLRLPDLQRPDTVHRRDGRHRRRAHHRRPARRRALRRVRRTGALPTRAG